MREYSKEAYQYSSAAPQRVEESPVRVRRRQQLSDEEIRVQSRRLQAQENQRSATRFGLLYTLVIIASVGIMAFSCISFIKAQSQHSTNAKKITSLTTQVNTLKETNDERKLAIDTSIDYDYIYRVAVKDLGMVYPGEGQIVKYTHGESEYVIQFQDFE